MNKSARLVQIKAGPGDGLADGEFQAYASVFGNIDSVGDKVIKGAFADTLADWKAKGDPIPLLFGHNMSDPDYNIGHIVEAREDDHGLWVNGQLDLEGPKSQQVYRLLKGRRLTQLSFAYEVLDGAQAKSEDEGDFYELRKLKLHEVSLVPVGANQETEVLTVKALHELVREVKAGRVISAKNEQLLRAAHESIGQVLSALDSNDGKATAGEPAKDKEPERVKSEEPMRPTPAMMSELLSIEVGA